MSARIAPEVISVGVTQAAKRANKPTLPSRPVENAGPIGADPKSQKNIPEANASPKVDKADTSARPPGKDPSVLPQSLFDAALIAEEYKPQTRPQDPAPQQAYFTSNDGNKAKSTETVQSQSTGSSAQPSAIEASKPASEQVSALTSPSKPTLASQEQSNSAQNPNAQSDVAYPSIGNLNAA